MGKFDQKDIDKFISITGLSTAVARKKLKEHHGDLSDAIDAVFIEADKSTTQDTISTAPQNDVMGVDDPQSFKSAAIDENPFSLTDHFGISYCSPLIPYHTHSVSRPREVPTEAGARNGVSGRSGRAYFAANVPDETIGIEKDMIRAAIEASIEDMEKEELVLAITLSLQTTEEKVMTDLNESVEASEQEKIQELPS